MAASRKIVKVFLASPGDLQDERRAVKHAVDVFNRQWADFSGIHVELVGWEDTVSQFGRPQESINRDLDQCELFIGLMWKKWGSPPSANGKYTSGFEEEFERSVENRQKSQRPEISLLFKVVDPALFEDPGEDLKKVAAFKNRIINERIVLFQEFNDPREFEDQIRGCVTNYVQRLQRDEAKRQSNESQVASSSLPDSGKAQSSGKATPFANEATSFLRTFVDDRNLTTEPLSPGEVARFRLLGDLISAQGNDEGSLGVHDANILYEEKESVAFSLQERFGLFDVALRNFADHNVPLWYWLVGLSNTLGGDLTFASRFPGRSRTVSVHLAQCGSSPNPSIQ